MGWFRKQVDTESIGADLAADMPDDLEENQVNSTLVALASRAEQEGYSTEQADDIAGAAYRAYLVKTGQAWRYPESC